MNNFVLDLDKFPPRSSFTIPGALPKLNLYIDAERSNRFSAAKIKKSATEVAAFYSKELKIQPDAVYDVFCIWTCDSDKFDSDNIFLESSLSWTVLLHLVGCVVMGLDT